MHALMLMLSAWLAILPICQSSWTIPADRNRTALVPKINREEKQRTAMFMKVADHG